MWRKQICIINFLPGKIKSINPIEKHPYIIESFSCNQKIFAFMFLFPINSLISSGIYSTPKLSK